MNAVLGVALVVLAGFSIIGYGMRRTGAHRRR